MPSLDRPSKQSHGTYRLEIVTIMLVQALIMVVVLIAALYLYKLVNRMLLLRSLWARRPINLRNRRN